MAPSPQRPQRLYVVRWMLAGVLLGALVTVVTWRITLAEAGSVTFAELHDAYPTLWIVDLAPTVLGLAGAIIGVLYMRLADEKQRVEATAQQIAASWNAELHATNEELAEALETRRRFHAAVTHELRTPLATILGFAGLAEATEPMAPELASYLAEISGAANTMEALVNDVLDAAKLEAHGIPLEITHVPCDAAIGEVVGRLAPLAQQKGLTIVVDAEEGLACRADPLRLRQILSNVVSNAIKYSESGTIAISGFRQKNGAPVIAVNDEGIGFGEGDARRIFEAFESSTNGVNRADSTGLGLAICASLVRAMDGDITAHSDGPGKGATFRLTLRPPTHEGIERRMASFAPEPASA